MQTPQVASWSCVIIVFMIVLFPICQVLLAFSHFKSVQASICLTLLRTAFVYGCVVLSFVDQKVFCRPSNESVSLRLINHRTKSDFLFQHISPNTLGPDQEVSAQPNINVSMYLISSNSEGKTTFHTVFTCAGVISYSTANMTIQSKREKTNASADVRPHFSPPD